MAGMWRYDLREHNPERWRQASLTRYDLVHFARRCDQKATINSKTPHSWILRFLIEELGCKASNIRILEVTEVGVIHASEATH